MGKSIGILCRETANKGKHSAEQHQSARHAVRTDGIIACLTCVRQNPAETNLRKRCPQGVKHIEQAKGSAGQLFRADFLDHGIADIGTGHSAHKHNAQNHEHHII